MDKINMLVEKYIKGSQRMILFAKDFDSAYSEALTIVLDEFGYQQSDVDTKVDVDNDKADFYFREFNRTTHTNVSMDDYTILAKMKKEGKNYTITIITG